MLLVRVLEWVRDPCLRVHNNGTINSGPEPGNMSMPEKGALLLHQCELICESLTSLDGTLGNIRWTIEPA